MNRCLLLTSAMIVSIAGFSPRVDGQAQTSGSGQPIDWNAKAPWGKTSRSVPLDADKREPFKIFDNVYYVGLESVSSYLITTSAGLVLLDATYAETAGRVLDSVRTLGFDPANIKYVVITHAHGDHYAGAGRIRAVAGARVASSAEDWAEIERQQSASAKPQDKTLTLTRDLVIKDGETLKLGDTVFKFYVTPGHTPGSLSVEYQVLDRGRSHRALSPGGVGFYFGPEWTSVYLKSMERLRQLGPWDVLLLNHPGAGPRHLFDVAKDLATPGQRSHPGVFGAAQNNDWFDAILKVAREKLAAEQGAAR